MKLAIDVNYRRAFLLAALGTAAVVGLASGQEKAASSKTAEMKAPHTAEEHFARAAEYEGKAKEYRQEVALHRKMLDDELKAAPPLKVSPEPASVVKMRKHCEDYIQKAQALAQEADRFAEFHRMRGKEMQGQ